MLIGALALVALELAAFWFAGGLALLAHPDEQAPARVLAAFVLFWSLLTLQAMLVVAGAWTMVAVSRTTLTAQGGRIALEHPWRRWASSRTLPRSPSSRAGCTSVRADGGARGTSASTRTAGRRLAACGACCRRARGWSPTPPGTSCSGARCRRSWLAHSPERRRFCC